MKKGFTLLEVLVAMSILAVSLVVVLQLFAGGLTSARLSDEYTRGVFYAREKMDEILLAPVMTEGVIDGAFEDGYQWRAQAAFLDLPETEGLRLPFRAFEIKVDVRWQAGEKTRRVTLSTIKLTDTIAGGP